jgi:hypothetical protein
MVRHRCVAVRGRWCATDAWYCEVDGKERVKVAFINNILGGWYSGVGKSVGIRMGGMFFRNWGEFFGGIDFTNLFSSHKCQDIFCLCIGID